MNRRPGRLLGVLTGVLLGILGAVVLPATPAAAHPLDVYLQAAYLTVEPATVSVELQLKPGVLVAPAVLAALDTDSDEQVSQAEADAYARQVARRLQLRVDGATLPLRLTKVEVPSYLTLQAGYGTLRLQLEAAGLPSAGAHRLQFRNDFATPHIAYQANTLLSPGIVITAQHRDATQSQTSVDYRIDPAATAAPGATPIPGAAAPPTANSPLEHTLRAPLSWWLLLLALGSAAALGSLHALTPGHAKTLMAAYLVGSGATTRNALTLGAVVTFTHTASVILIGLLALAAGRFLVPGVLVPALEIGSGLLVLGLGLRLLRRRWPHRHDHQPHSHAHAHGHGHAQGHGHALPDRVTPRALLLMGLSGGLVPCPEALGVLVLAVGLHRTAFGISLIVAFSVGLAAELMGLGALLVHARPLVLRITTSGALAATWLPLVSAAIVTALGLGLIARGLA